MSHFLFRREVVHLIAEYGQLEYGEEALKKFQKERLCLDSLRS